jgi:hypothetical protein
MEVVGGQVIVFDRQESTTWGPYGSSHWPESKSVSYLATLYAADGTPIATTEFSRRGKWLDRVLEKFGVCRMPPCPNEPEKIEDDFL